MALSERSKAVLSATLVLIAILIFVLLAEGIVRVRQYVKYGTFTQITHIQADPDSGLLIPPKGMKTATMSINSLGFRGPEIEMPKPSNRLRVGFLGASTTYCAEVSSNELVWTDLISRELENSIPSLSVDYINGGVPGYTTKASIINLEKRLLPLQPDIVIIYHATNDLSGETRSLAEQQGIKRTNLATEQSWLGQYSLLWHLAEKNLVLLTAENPTSSEYMDFDPTMVGNEFRQNLERIVNIALENGVKLVALVTFSTHLRDGMDDVQKDAAMASARYYMPYLSADDLLLGFKYYNQIIREVATKTGALLIEDENGIPGDPIHFNDSVHFTDVGSHAQSKRIVQGLLKAPSFQAIARNN